MGVQAERSGPPPLGWGCHSCSINESFFFSVSAFGINFESLNLNILIDMETSSAYSSYLHIIPSNFPLLFNVTILYYMTVKINLTFYEKKWTTLTTFPTFIMKADDLQQ